MPLSRTQAETVISYCATFLKPEMLHVYRQVIGLRSVNNVVVTRRRENAHLFPYEKVEVLKKSPWRAIQRLRYRSLGRPVPVSSFEAAQLDKICRRSRAELLHVYFGTEATRLLPWLRKCPVPFIISFHGADVSESVDSQDFAELCELSTLLLHRSDSLRDALLLRDAPAEKLRPNPTGIPIPAAVDPLPDLIGKPIRFLQACRFIEKKGLDTTLHAIKLLSIDGLPVELTLAGDGPLRTSLETLSAQLGIQHLVRFTGFLDAKQLHHEYSYSHIFLHPSRETSAGDREGIPNSLLEAMARGRLVVATNHSGIPEAIRDGHNGLLIPRSDPSALATSLRDALANWKNCLQIAKNARETVATKFSTETCIEKLEAAYQEAISLARIR
jgi:colanic acid/amylovoran biosynthesis glycosyltransferase